MVRRTVAEIIARYDSEPTLCDLYVEGKSDEYFYKWLFKCAKLDVQVFTISNVEIAGAGNRDRIFNLFTQIANAIPEHERLAVRGTCDNDLDYVRDKDTSTSSLIYPCDFYDIEGYFATPQMLGKLIDLNPISKCLKPDEILDNLLTALAPVAALRAAIADLGVQARHVPVTSYLYLESTTVCFEIDRYRGNVLNCNNIWHIKDALAPLEGHFLDRIKLLPDLRCVVKGKDLVDSIAWYFRNYTNDAVLRRHDAFLKMIRVAIEFEMVSNAPRINRLLRHFGWADNLDPYG